MVMVFVVPVNVVAVVVVELRDEVVDVKLVVVEVTDVMVFVVVVLGS
jgi:hypothetical protein